MHSTFVEENGSALTWYMLLAKLLTRARIQYILYGSDAAGCVLCLCRACAIKARSTLGSTSVMALGCLRTKACKICLSVVLVVFSLVFVVLWHVIQTDGAVQYVIPVQESSMSIPT